MDFTLNKISKYVDNHTSLDQQDASRKIKEVEELINQRRQFHGGLVVDNPQWTRQVLSTTSLSGEAVKACIEEIWRCLMDDEITVSKEMSIAKLQKGIASKIGVVFSGDEDETTRAGMLLETLTLRKRVEPIARSIAKQCAGLPLGVITIASCMRGIDDICEWRNALTELKDWEIREEKLIQLWIVEGLVEEVDSIQAMLDRGRAIMNRLIRNCLLEVFIGRENERTVKMHDLLRDMALDIVGSRFLVKSGMMLEEALDVQD
ncbi:hypothetical protein V6N11_079175 [Hibiscus sabdariffa]|uniref:Disease resistance protein winged helix domain-containing protein n=1 Tax=Hibiscus sabdariffa TaxID=183260 RepID=A0ABR2RUL6_9ROSI